MEFSLLALLWLRELIFISNLAEILFLIHNYDVLTVRHNILRSKIPLACKQ